MVQRLHLFISAKWLPAACHSFVLFLSDTFYIFHPENLQHPQISHGFQVANCPTETCFFSVREIRNLQDKPSDRTLTNPVTKLLNKQNFLQRNFRFLFIFKQTCFFFIHFTVYHFNSITIIRVFFLSNCSLPRFFAFFVLKFIAKTTTLLIFCLQSLTLYYV